MPERPSGSESVTVTFEVAFGPSFASVSVYSTVSPTFGEVSFTLFVNERSATDGEGSTESLFGGFGSGVSLVTSAAFAVSSALSIVAVSVSVAVSPLPSVPTS